MHYFVLFYNAQMYYLKLYIKLVVLMHSYIKYKGKYSLFHQNNILLDEFN